MGRRGGQRKTGEGGEGREGNHTKDNTIETTERIVQHIRFLSHKIRRLKTNRLVTENFVNIIANLVDVVSKLVIVVDVEENVV